MEKTTDLTVLGYSMRVAIKNNIAEEVALHRVVFRHIYMRSETPEPAA